MNKLKIVVKVKDRSGFGCVEFNIDVIAAGSWVPP